MSRAVSAAMAAALARGEVRPVVFAEVEFESTTYRFWTGIYDVVTLGETWLGVGHFGGISAIAETSDIQASGIALHLSGIPTGLLASVIGDARQGAPCTVYFGLLDENYRLIDTPTFAFAGGMDTLRLTEDGDTATVELQVESRLIVVEESLQRRYTNADQQSEYAGDLGFEYAGQDRIRQEYSEFALPPKILMDYME